MSIEKKHIIYTAEDIQKYLTGGMNNAEMYAIEKAALDDPFLAEAIEGYDAMEQKDWSKELLVLKKRLEVVENTPVVPVYKTSFPKWWRAAAAVLAIGSTVAIAYLFTNKQADKNVMIAEVTPVKDSTAGAKMDSAGNIVTPISTTAADIVQNKNGASATIITADSTKQILLANTTTTNQTGNDFVYTPSPATVDYRNKDVTLADREKTNAGAVAGNTGNATNAQLDEVSSDKNIRSQNNGEGENFKFDNNVPSNYFNAQVITADNKPVAYANIKPLQNKNIKPVYTDTKGNFGLAAADSTVTVVVTSAGYVPQKYTLQNSAEQNKIVLQPADVVTQEITVSKKREAGKAELKKEAVNAEMDEDDAEPFGGWVEYNNYLNNNLVFPNEAKEKNIHGEVEVYVDLKSNGDISKIKVDKKLCPECDAEAIRLVKEGPKWDVKKNKATKAKVKIKF